jgi:hypothetical protein
MLSRTDNVSNDMAVDLNLNHYSIHNVADATSNSDAPNYGQVIDLISNLNPSADLALRPTLALVTGATLIGTPSGTVQSNLTTIFGSDIGTAPSGATQGFTQQRTLVGAADGTTTYYGQVSRVTINGANAITEARTNYNGLEINCTSATTTTAIGEHRYVWVQGSGNVTNLRVYEGHFRADSTGGVTSTANVFNIANPTWGAGTGNVAQLVGYNSVDLGHATRVGTAIGFNQTDITAGPTLAIAFRGQVSSGTGKYNLYMVGTADNYFAGQLGLGTTAPAAMLHVRKDLNGDIGPIIQNRNSSGTPVSAIRFITGVFDLSDNRLAAIKSSGGASPDLQFWVSNGANSFKAWNVLPTGAAGYATGVGGAVTQTTSRTTGVSLNKVCGQITLVSAAGSATWQTFTVTNSVVASTDVIRLNQCSGTDKYMLHVTKVQNGSFDVTFATTGGTTTEQPVFNFTVMKAVNA